MGYGVYTEQFQYKHRILSYFDVFSPQSTNYEVALLGLSVIFTYGAN